MDCKENSGRRSLHEGSNRKALLASNMYMFKVRAFQDILKTRNGNSSGSQRHFKYNVEDEVAKKKNRKNGQITQTEDVQVENANSQDNEGQYDQHFGTKPQKEERSPPRPSPRPSPKASYRASPRNSPRRSPKPSARQYLSPSHQQSIEDPSQQLRYLSCAELRQRYKNLNQLCEQQLLVLHETKSLLERETTRNTILSQNYDTSHRQTIQLRQQLTMALQKLQKECQLRHQIQQNLQQQSHLRQQLQSRIQELNSQANHTQNDILLLKKSMESYQIELQHVTQDKSQQIQHLQQQITHLKQHIHHIEQEQASEKQRFCFQKCQLQGELLSLQNSHQFQLEQKDTYIRQQQNRLQCLMNDIASLEKQYMSQKNAKTLEISNLQSYVSLLQQQKQYTQKEYDVVKSVVERQRRLLTERETEKDRMTQQITTKTEEIRRIAEQADRFKTICQEFQLKHETLRLESEEIKMQRQNLQEQFNQLQGNHKQLQQSNFCLQTELSNLQQQTHHLQHLLTTSRQSIVNTLQCGKEQIEKQRKLFNEIADQNFTLRCRIAQLQK